ncbi:MAG: preQ(1) synthase [Kiritimatiellae bacterium]|jgi:7-cyano-7-deazaguanine reductase|nr:preQ(1) synthase [Kiritimatiellia bacterium]
MSRRELKALGNSVVIPSGYDPSVLEAFENRHPGRDYWVTFTAPEFTTLCPKTGQPDFATLTIRYIPSRLLVESKSLKLYLFSFRNHGDFHEDVVNVIYDDIFRLLKPKYLEVFGKFAARGGITIDPFVNGGTGAKYRRLAESRFSAWNGVR